MTETLNKIKTNAATPVNPTWRKAIAFLVEKFDCVQKQKKGQGLEFKQAYANLPGVKEDAY